MPGMSSYWDAQRSARESGTQQGDVLVNAFAQRQNRDVGAALNAGDTSGATNIFRRVGRLDDANTLETNIASQATARRTADAAEHARQAAIALTVTRAVRARLPTNRTPTTEEYQAAFDANVPILGQAGLRPEQVTAFRQAYMEDPHGFLDTIDTLRQQEPFTLTAAPGGTSTRYGSDGRPVASVSSAPQPRYQLDGAGNLVRTDSGAFEGGSYPPTMGTPTPAPSPGAPSTPATAAPAQPSRPIRSASGPLWNQVLGAVAPLNPTPAEVTFLGQTFQAESSGGRNTRGRGSSQGGFQFHPDTFRGVMPNGNIGSLNDQAQAALTLARQNETTFQRQFNREPTAGDLYLMHQQGTPGALALMTAPPEVNAIAAVAPAYRGDLRLARQAILNNGGTPDMTAGEFVQQWRGRFNGGGPAPEQQTAASPPPRGGPPATIGQPRPVEQWVDTGNAGEQRNTRTGELRGARRTTLRTLPPNQVPQGWPVGTQIDSEGGLHAPPSSGGGAGAATLTPAAIEQLAQQYILDPTVVRNVGIGSAGSANRTAIINRASEIQAVTGTSGADAVVQHAGVRAAQQALTTQTRYRAAVVGFERTLLANADQVERLAPQGTAGGIPIFNRWVQAGRRHVAGDPQLAAFDTAITTVANEYAKISEGATGAGGSSVEARRAASQMINSAQTLPQLLAVIGQMRTDAHNRTAALDSVITDLSTSIRNAGGAVPTQPGTAQPGGRYVATRQQAPFVRNATGPAGSRTNPRLIRPGHERTDHAAVQSGQWYVMPNGERLQKQ